MTLALNSYQTMAVGILLYYLGKFLKARIKFLRTYCIPNPVIGGILFALLNLALHQSGVGAIKLDTVQQSFFMNMFFTSIGFTASFALLKKGGRDVLILTIVCAILVTLQDVIGVGLAKVVACIRSLVSAPVPYRLSAAMARVLLLVLSLKTWALNAPVPLLSPWQPSA